MIPFWNKDCKKLSDQLWKPKDDFRESPMKDPSWNCDNKNISFKYFVPIEKVNIDFDFKPIPVQENTIDKRKMFFGKFNVEINRLEKKVKKNKINNDILKKHLKSIRKIQENVKKIDNIKKKHKDFFIKISKEISSLKKKFEKINMKDKCYPIIKQHFEQTDKIYKKMERLDNIVYCKKVKIILTREQNIIIRSWYLDTIEIYNGLTEEFNEIHNKIRREYQKTDKEIQYGKYLAAELKKNIKFPIGAQKLRNSKIGLLTKKYDVPFCIIADTIMQFSSNLKGNLTKIQKGQIDDFEFKPKKITGENKTIPIQQKYTSDKGFYPSILGAIKTEDIDFDWKSICSDYKIVYDQYHDTFNLHIPSYKQHQNVPYNRDPFASLDPGMRSFQQLYGLNHVIAVGENLYWPIMEKIDKIESMERKLKIDSDTKKNKKVRKVKTKKLSNSSRKNIRNAIARTHIKIKDLVTEMHNKLCIFLCESYDRIMVTDFSSRKVNGKQEGLPRNHKKVLGKLSHYNFRQRLAHKCQEYRCQYLEVTEEYTSKTCCNCGELKYNLGTAKHYDCDKCHLSIDRDTNGAINIFIKNRSEVL